MAILSDFDIFAQILNSSGMPQSEHYAPKSASVVRLQHSCPWKVKKEENQGQNESKIGLNSCFPNRGICGNSISIVCVVGL